MIPTSPTEKIDLHDLFLARFVYVKGSPRHVLNKGLNYLPVHGPNHLLLGVWLSRDFSRHLFGESDYGNFLWLGKGVGLEDHLAHCTAHLLHTSDGRNGDSCVKEL